MLTSLVHLLAMSQVGTCVILLDFSLHCWGWNFFGQYGDGTNIYPQFQSKNKPPENGTLFTNGLIPKQLGLSVTHACVMFTDESIRCWGDNLYGSLGDGTTTESNRIPEQAIQFPNNLRPKTLIVGEYRTCTIMIDNTLWCWGKNSVGELGIGSTSGFNTSNPTQVISPNNLGVLQLSLGAAHSCAIFLDQSARCWGNNQVGQLGDGTNVMKSSPPQQEILFPGGLKASLISAGGSHTCALLTDETIRCWGENEFGQLGDGTSGVSTRRSSPPNSPIEFVNNLKPKMIHAGGSTTCVLLSDESLHCWGDNTYGQLGDGTFNQTSEPPLNGIVFSNGTNITYFSLNDRICVHLSDFTVKCWGRNDFGQLGDGSYVDKNVVPADALVFNILGSGSPTSSPSGSPTLSPSPIPSTSSPTTYVPSTIPSDSLSKSPSTLRPSSSPVGVAPSISTPSVSPNFREEAESRQNGAIIGGVTVSICLTFLMLALFLYRRRMKRNKESKINNGVVKPSLGGNEELCNSIVVSPFTGKSVPAEKIHFGFISHYKEECGVEARLLHTFLTKELEKRRINKSIFLDSDHLHDLRQLTEHIKSSSVVIVCLSKSILTRPWCLLEIYTAIQFNIPIVTVRVADRGYDFDAAIKFLSKFSSANLDRRNPGASKTLKNMGIECSQIGVVVKDALSSVIAIEFNPKSSQRIITSSVEDLVDRIIKTSN